MLPLAISHTLPLTDPVLKFLIILVIIIAAPLLLNKLKIPHLLGLIIAGAIIGPYGLNLILRDSSIILSGTASFSLRTSCSSCPRPSLYKVGWARTGMPPALSVTSITSSGVIFSRCTKYGVWSPRYRSNASFLLFTYPLSNRYPA